MREGRARWLLVVSAALLPILLGMVVNLATGLDLPAFTENPWVIWPALVLLSALSVLVALVGTRDDPTSAPTAAVGVSALPVPGAVPRATRYFTGRETLLAELGQTLQAEGLVTLTGLGGVGKTQLALAYLRQHRDQYGLVWWLRAEQAPTLAEDYAALADAKQLTDPAASIADKTAAAHRWLQERDQRWLLVFDNAADAATITSYLPGDTSHGRALVTSRDRLWPEVATIAVEPLARDESVQFLDEQTSSDPGTAAALAELLGDLPLALEQARAYLAIARQPAAAYLQDLQRELAARSGELLGEGTPGHYQATVATTWTLSIRQAGAEAPGAAELLTLLAFLAPEGIPRSLPAEHPGRLPRRLRRVAADPGSYQRAVGALARYSLLTLTEETLTVHRLVQAVARQELNRRAARRWAGVAVRLVWTAFPEDSDDVRSWPVCARLLPHALATTQHAQRLQADPRATVGLLNQAGNYLSERAELAAARDILQRALDIRLARLRPDYRVATSLTNLGLVLHRLGEFTAARDAYEHALVIGQVHLGPNDPRVATILNNLGAVLRDLGEPQAALDLLQRALAIRQARLGPDQTPVARSLMNLGAVLRDLGEPQAARDAQQRALTIYKARLSPDHPHVAEALTNLGGALCDLGDLKGARDAHQRALTIYEARLGPDHPHIARSLDSLGVVLYELGELHAARHAHQRALTIFEARLRPDHPDVGTAGDNLATVLAALNERPGQPTADH